MLINTAAGRGMSTLTTTQALEPGMHLAEPICWKGQTLVGAGAKLSPRAVAVVKMRRPHAMVRVVDRSVDAFIEFDDDFAMRSLADEVRQHVGIMLTRMGRLIQADKAIAHADIDPLVRLVPKLLGTLRRNRLRSVLPMHTYGAENYLAEHAGNGFVLAVAITLSLRDFVVAERERLTADRMFDFRALADPTPLGLALTLMDLGMFELESVTKRPGPLEPEELDRVRCHPQRSSALLPRTLSPLAHAIIRTHHEEMDGGGYPKGLGRERLHVFSRIARAVDAFDAGIAPRPYHAAKHPARVIWEMAVSPIHTAFDHRIVAHGAFELQELRP